MNLSRRILSVAVVAVVLFWAADSLAQDNAKVRRWTSKDGTQSIKARLLNYDEENQTVELVTTSGDEVELSLDKLSSLDRRYLRGWARKRGKSGDSDTQQDRSGKDRSGAIAQDSSRKAKKGRGRKADPNTKQLFGIEWTPSLDGAKELAVGKQESHKDDRPILWFRVLGQLDGFM